MRARRPFTHSVEGSIDGVPFCRYFKRLDAALTCARQTKGKCYDLVTLQVVDFTNQQTRRHTDEAQNAQG